MIFVVGHKRGGRGGDGDANWCYIIRACCKFPPPSIPKEMEEGSFLMLAGLVEKNVSQLLLSGHLNSVWP